MPGHNFVNLNPTQTRPRYKILPSLPPEVTVNPRSVWERAGSAFAGCGGRSFMIWAGQSTMRFRPSFFLKRTTLVKSYLRDQFQRAFVESYRLRGPMTHLEVTDFFKARAEVGGKNSENGSDSRPPYGHQGDPMDQPRL